MSLTAARKERERATREELIIEHARRLLLRDGFQNFNLDELAKSIEYSKGTIYLHFSTKEDLALAVATSALRERADLFERAGKFQGQTRERIRAIGVACVQFGLQHTDFVGVEMMLKSISFWEKASEERKRINSVQGARAFHAVNNIVLEAIHKGDLPGENARPENITMSLIAITVGSQWVAFQPDLRIVGAVEDPMKMLRFNQDVVCDGWGWKPLYKDWDYAATDRRIKKEIFPEATWLH